MQKITKNIRINVKKSDLSKVFIVCQTYVGLQLFTMIKN